MSKSISKLYRIDALTDMHPGSGKNDYSIIDHTVQRDAGSGLPCINGSSFKGATKQWMAQNGKTDVEIKPIFGSDTTANSKTPSGDSHQGGSTFMKAHLLALSVPCDLAPNVTVTCPAVIKNLIKWSDNLGLDLGSGVGKDLNQLSNLSFGDNKSTVHSLTPTLIDGHLSLYHLNIKETISSDLKDAITTIFSVEDNRFCLISDKFFMRLTNDLNLPVVPRNALDNGVSKNLWYVQVIPSGSQFFVPIIWGDDVQEKLFKDIQSKPMQIGGDASIGLGFTTINSISC